MVSPDLTLVVSDGPAPVQVPDVSGQTYDTAAANLANRGFTATRADDQFSDTVPAGQVISTNPPGGNYVNRGSTIQVVVSKGPDLVTVPDLRLLTLEVAQQRLVALGLDVDSVGYLPGRLVLRTTPAANEKVKKGSKVTLVF